MTPAVAAFLAAEDLDDVLRARQAIVSLDDDDTLRVRAVLQEWQDRQAVSNLLLYPDLIPGDARLPALLRGIAEREVAYYVLAAVVGFQGIDPAKLSADERNKVTTDLWDIICQTDGVIAERASVSVAQYATDADVAPMFFLLDHFNKTVKHNVRAWLFGTFKDRGIEAFIKVAKDSGISAEAGRQVIDDFNAFVTNPPPGFKSPLCPLYSYLPNLREVV